MELVSTIITTYNRTIWLKKCIESVINQSVSQNEIIVIDDGSDNSDAQKIVRAFPKVNYIYQQNQGLGAARNTGIQACNGTYVQFLDDDDWLSENAISEKLNQFKIDPNINIAYSDLYITDAIGNIKTTFFANFKRPLPSGDIFPALLTKNFIPIHSILWKKSDLISLGGFPKRSGHEDWELLIRLSEFGLFQFIDKPLGFYRNHGQNMSKDFRKMMEGKLSFQPLIVNLPRFITLPKNNQRRILSKFAVQQYAFGKEKVARDFISKIKTNSTKVDFLLFAVNFLILLPKSFSRILIRLNHMRKTIS